MIIWVCLILLLVIMWVLSFILLLLCVVLTDFLYAFKPITGLQITMLPNLAIFCCAKFLFQLILWLPLWIFLLAGDCFEVYSSIFEKLCFSKMSKEYKGHSGTHVVYVLKFQASQSCRNWHRYHHALKSTKIYYRE